VLLVFIMQIDRPVYDLVRQAVHAHFSALKADTSELEVKYVKPLQRQRFTDALRYFRTATAQHGRGVTDLVEEKSIDVTVNVSDADAYRVTVPSYVMAASLDREAAIKEYTIIQKTRTHPPVEISEYGIRVNVKTEQSIAPAVKGLRSVIVDALESASAMKTVRQKHRFSAFSKDGLFRYDMTSVRQTSTKAPYGSDIARGKLLTAPDTYEMEIELVQGSDLASLASGGDNESRVKAVALKLLGASSLMLKVIEDVDHLLPESAKKAVIREYGVLVGVISNDEEGKRLIDAHLGGGGGNDGRGRGAVQQQRRRNNPPNNSTDSIPFVGPKPVTLMKNNVLLPPVPGEVSVLKGYTLTEKADGERRLLFVDKVNRVYTIDDRLNVAYTGLTSRGPASTLLDGEFMPARKTRATTDVIATSAATNGMHGGAKTKKTRSAASIKKEKATRGKDGISTYGDSASSTLASHQPQQQPAHHLAAMYMCFDAYFVGGKDVRGFPLLDRRPDVPDRISIAEKVFADGFDKRAPTDCDCIVKKFYAVDSQSELFARANSIFRERDAGMFPYQIDGLIFTPALLAVGEDMPPAADATSTYPHENKRADREEDGEEEEEEEGGGGGIRRVEGGGGDRTAPRLYRGGGWNSAFKWKPPEMNTIDFLVRFHDNDMVTGTRVEQRDNVFRVVDLYVGRRASTQPVSILDALTGRWNMSAEKRGERDGSTDYIAVKFHPDGESRRVHQAYLKLNEDKRIIIEETGEEITDSVVVEFSLDNPQSQEEVAFRWRPLRIRHDKTQRYHANGKSVARAANDYKNARGVWQSIHDPVTEQMLRGEDMRSVRSDARSLDMQAQKQYYKRGDKSRSERASLPMLDFHNAWVKERAVLGPFAGKVTSIFDIGSGEGGDITKWRRMPGLTRVMGVDYDKHNIVNREGGAYARLQRRLPQAVSDPVIVFFPMDGSKPFGAGQIDTLPDADDVRVGRILWGLEDVNAVRHPRMKDMYGFAARAFDLVSCQFAVHYFFADIASLRTFAKNVASVLREGGFFVGTCLDGASVDAALGGGGGPSPSNEQQVESVLGGGVKQRRGRTTTTMTTKPLPLSSSSAASNAAPAVESGADKQDGTVGASIQGTAEDGTLMWHVQKLYKGGLRDAPLLDRTGRKVRVFMESIGQAVDEYLVDFELLNWVMAEVGLTPVTESSREDLGLLTSTGGFGELFDDMREHVAREGETDRRVASALSMSDTHKRYSFLNRFFVFQKTK
jgi:hypothetical protein